MRVPTVNASRIAASKFGRIEPRQFKELIHALADARFPPALEMRNQTDVPRYREMGKQSDVLDDIADPAAQADRVPIPSGPVLHDHLSARRFKKPIDQFQSRCFA